MVGGKPEPPASGFQGGEPETRKTQPQPSPAELGSQSPSCPAPRSWPVPGPQNASCGCFREKARDGEALVPSLLADPAP